MVRRILAGMLASEDHWLGPAPRPPLTGHRAYTQLPCPPPPPPPATGPHNMYAYALSQVFPPFLSPVLGSLWPPSRAPATPLAGRLPDDQDINRTCVPAMCRHPTLGQGIRRRRVSISMHLRRPIESRNCYIANEKTLETSGSLVHILTRHLCSAMCSHRTAPILFSFRH